MISGGPIGDRKGINLPGVNVAAPSLTEKDLVDLTLGLEAGVDLVALSFVRGGQDVRRLREVLQAKGATNPIISKIEKARGLGKPGCDTGGVRRRHGGPRRPRG